MTNLKLDQYVETVAARLKTLPEAEKQQQIAELRQHLESLVTANQSEGESEEIATESALQQFGSAQEIGADLGRSVWRMRLKRLPDAVVTMLSIIAGLAMITLLFRFGYGPLIRAIVLPLPPPGNVGVVTTIQQPVLTPSFVLGMAALALLAFRDGATSTVRRLMNFNTITGAALCWMVLQKLSQSVLMIWLNHAMIARNLWDMESIQAVSLVFTVVPSAFAGWIAARLSPKQGMKGIFAGVALASLLNFMDAVAHGGAYLLSAPSHLLVQWFGIPTVIATASITVAAGMASVLNRRRHARTA